MPYLGAPLLPKGSQLNLGTIPDLTNMHSHGEKKACSQPHHRNLHFNMLNLLLRAQDQRRDRRNACFPAQEAQICLRPVQCQQGEVSWRRSSMPAPNPVIIVLQGGSENLQEARTGRHLKDCVKQKKRIWRTTMAEKVGTAPSLSTIAAEMIAMRPWMVSTSNGKAKNLRVYFEWPTRPVFGLYRR